MHKLLQGVLVVLLLCAAKSSAQRGVTRVCGLQIVIDHLLWAHVRDQVGSEDGLIKDPDEIVRIARFRLSSLTSRLVNTANSVLDRYYFSNTKYKLLLQNITVSMSWQYQQAEGALTFGHPAPCKS